MFTEIITPRFLETDALGHINNTTYAIWFEAARDEFFKIFNPTSDINKWNLVMASSNINFLKEVFWGKDVVIKTAISKLGNSSIELSHGLYQDDILCTTCKCVMIHYDFKNKKAILIPTLIRDILKEHEYLNSWPKNLEELT